MIPYVIDSKGNGLDIYSALLKDRIIFLGGVSAETANIVISQLLYLASEDSGKDIHLYLNSRGGSMEAGLGIIDTMDSIQPDVATYAIGMAASMASVILCCGAKRKRFALPHATILMHEGRTSNLSGPIKDIRIEVSQIISLENRINKMIAERTGKTLAEIEDDCKRDLWLNPEQSLHYGIIDCILC